MRIILIDPQPADFVLAGYVVRWMMENPLTQDAILDYRGGGQFYATRNKASITIRMIRDQASSIPPAVAS